MLRGNRIFTSNGGSSFLSQQSLSLLHEFRDLPLMLPLEVFYDLMMSFFHCGKPALTGSLGGKRREQLVNFVTRCLVTKM